MYIYIIHYHSILRPEGLLPFLFGGLSVHIILNLFRLEIDLLTVMTCIALRGQ